MPAAALVWPLCVLVVLLDVVPAAEFAPDAPVLLETVVEEVIGGLVIVDMSAGTV